MAEYIERSTALSALADLAATVGAEDECSEEAIKACMRVLRPIPAEDVAPVVHGQWIKDNSGVICCSNCGEEHEWDDYRAPYCDTCGAKMDGGKKHE